MRSMKVKLNGQDKELNNSNLKQLIDESCRGNKHVIAEVNGAIIKGAQWEQIHICDGDTIELVSFVGGG